MRNRYIPISRPTAPLRAHRRSHPPCRTGAELWSAHCDPCTPNAPRCESGTANPILSPSQETGQCPKIQRKQPREPVRPPTPSERSTNPPPFVSSGDQYTCTDYFTNQKSPFQQPDKASSHPAFILFIGGPKFARYPRRIPIIPPKSPPPPQQLTPKSPFPPQFPLLFLV